MVYKPAVFVFNHLSLTNHDCMIVLLLIFADYSIWHYCISPPEGAARGDRVDGTGFSGENMKDTQHHYATHYPYIFANITMQ